MAVAGIPLRRQAPCIRGRERLSHLHDAPESACTQGQESLRQRAAQPRQEHYPHRRDHS